MAWNHRHVTGKLLSLAAGFLNVQVELEDVFPSSDMAWLAGDFLLRGILHSNLQDRKEEGRREERKGKRGEGEGY